MRVDPHTAKHRAEHDGAAVLFLLGRLPRRSSWPTRAVSRPSGRAAKAEPVPEGTIYTCPMHPEIRQVGPGSCPICGMALEPVLVSADAGPESTSSST